MNQHQIIISLLILSGFGHPIFANCDDNCSMVVGTIIEKSYIRSSPSEADAPTMSVSPGTRLAIETRQGDWYRVITPTGTRGWVKVSQLNSKFAGEAHCIATPIPSEPIEGRAADRFTRDQKTGMYVGENRHEYLLDRIEKLENRLKSLEERFQSKKDGG